MSKPTNVSPLLKLFAQILKKVPDPRSQQGQSYPLHTLLALTFLGLIANCTNPAELARWSKEDGRLQTAADSDRISSPLAFAINCRLQSTAKKLGWKKQTW